MWSVVYFGDGIGVDSGISGPITWPRLDAHLFELGLSHYYQGEEGPVETRTP